MSDDVEEIVELKHSPTLDDIREWGRQRGYDVPDKGRLPKGLRADYMETNGIDPSISSVPDRVEEKAPQVEVERTPVQRVRGLVNRRSAKVAKGPRAKRARVSTEGVVSGIWSLLALAAKPISMPASRMLSLEAPTAGMILDDAIRGTIIDKVLQPIARTSDAGKTFGALMAPPMLVAAIDKFPERTEILLPLLRQSLVWHIEVAGPKMDEKIQRQQEFEDKYGQTIDQMLMMIFSDVGTEEEA